MTKEEIFEFAANNPVFSLATIEGNQPHVRYMMLYRADEGGFIFVTGRDKDVNRQLQANPTVEMCFYDIEKNEQVRIAGKVEFLDDLELKKQILEFFTFLKPLVEKLGYEIMVCCRVKNGKAITWKMETNLEPKQYIQL